jgi:hypothetical protein
MSNYTKLKKDSNYKIQRIIKDTDIELLKRKYVETIDIMKIVEDFIIKKKFLLYGGYAINLLLPKDDKFYAEYNINDYDCYSVNAKEDAYEIADIFYKKKYEYIEVKQAVHENTYRLYVNFIQVLDLTLISKELFDSLFKITLYERSTSIYKYYNDFDKYIVPAVLLKRNLHYELARPIDSYYRWEKIYSRLKIFNKLLGIYKYDKKNKINTKYIPPPSNYKNIIDLILNYIKEYKYPIIDNYAIKLYKNIKSSQCCRINPKSNYLTIISKNYIKTANNIIKLLKLHIDTKIYKIYILKRDYLPDIMNKRCRVNIENLETKEIFTLINIVDSANDCYSYVKIKDFYVGSIDTILYFMYSIYIIYFIFSKKDNNILHETLYYIKLYEDIIDKKYIKDVYERLSIECYGNKKYKTEVRQKYWNNKISVYRPENKSKNNI